MKRNELRVSDLMTTALITVTASEPVTAAHAEMQVGVVRHLPVVDERHRLVGVLSDRDVLRALGHRPAKRIADVMTRDVISVRPETHASEAAALMLELKISSVLVVDDASTLIGMVTQTDYLDLARRSLLGLPLERQ
jgi:CBS domain-containing membrane protein